MSSEPRTHARYSPRRRQPRVFVLQWHVTERCNLRCAHCYQEGYRSEELSFVDLLDVVEQFQELLGDLREREAPRPVRGHINVSGGEPFVRRDFLELLAAFAGKRDEFSFAILSNGTLIDAALAERLRELGPAFVQVSVEGTRETNDRVRGAGSYDRIVAALEHLAAAHVPAVISFTAHRANYKEFPAVAELGRRLRATRVWSDRLIPWGSATSSGYQTLDPHESRELFECMGDARLEAGRTFGSTEIYLGRALQFLIGGGAPYRCAAGDDLLTLQADGEVLPCRRLPIPVGHVQDSSLREIYWQSELCQRLRAHRVSDGCESCAHAETCRGGLRCLAYALTGDPFRPDPGCWRVASPPQRPAEPSATTAGSPGGTPDA